MHIWSFVCKTKKQLKSLVGTDWRLAVVVVAVVAVVVVVVV